MDQLSLENILAMLLITLGAGFVQSSIGFGFAIVALPFLVMILPMQQSVAILSVLGTCCYIQNVYRLRKHIDLSIVYVPLLASLVGRILGMQVLMGSNAGYIKIFLGFFFIVISIYFAFYQDKIKIKYNVKNGLIFGFISGIFGGMFNISGPPIVLYYLAGNLSKEKFMTSLQTYLLLSTSFNVILHLYHGNVNLSTWSYSAIGLFGVAVGSYFGLKVFHKLNVKLFNQLVCVFLACSGVYTIITSVIALL